MLKNSKLFKIKKKAFGVSLTPSSWTAHDPSYWTQGLGKYSCLTPRCWTAYDLLYWTPGLGKYKLEELDLLGVLRPTQEFFIYLDTLDMFRQFFVG